MKVNFSQNELWLLLTHFSPSVIVGFQDPTTGLLVDEIDQLRENARKRLIDRGLIHSAKDDGFSIDASIRDQMKLITNPEHSVLAGIQTAKNGLVVHSYHYGQKTIVHLVENGEGQYQIEIVDDCKAIVIILMEFYQTSIFLVDHSNPFYLPEKSIEEIRSLCAVGKLQEAHQTLEKVSSGEIVPKEFFSVLHTPTVNMSLVIFTDRHKKERTQVKGFAVLANDHSLWILEPTDEKDNLVRITRATKADLEQKIDTSLP